MVGQYDPANPGNPTNFQQLAGCANPSPLGGCAYNYAAFNQVQPQTTNIDLLLRHTMDFGSGWGGSVTASMFESKAEQVAPPSTSENFWPSLLGGVNATDPTAQPILLPVGNVNNPYPNNPAWLAYTFGDVGPVHTLTDTRMFRLVLDLRGSAAGWDLDSSIGAIRGLTHLTYENYVTLSGLDTVLADNSYHVGANANLNTAAVYSTLTPTTYTTASSQLQYLELNATRTVLALPGGPLRIAFGAGARHSGQDDPGQPGTITGNVLDYGTTFIHGTETNENVHAEIAAPLLKSLEADAAVRFDNYAGTGNATTPKIGLKWQPFEAVVLRGTYSRGFRAPGPGEKGHSGVTFFTTAPPDPLRCPTTALPSDCGGGSARPDVVGNPLLKPEKSENYTLGIVLQPIRQVSLSVDWWEIRRTDEIELQFADTALIRGPVQAAYPTLPGPIVSFAAPYLNLGVDEPKGLDFDLQTKFELGAAGTVGFDLAYTHLISQWICQTSDPTTCVDVAGTHGPSGISGDTGTPRNRSQATLDYGQGPAEVGLTLNYVSGYSNTDPTIGFGGPNNGGCMNSWYTHCYISSFTDFDLFGRYQVTKNLLLNAHVLNLFNTLAPFDPQAATGYKNYNSAFAEQGAIGRFFELGLKFTL